MSCPHVNEYEQCQDCPDYPCSLVTPKVAEAMPKRALPDCGTCPIMRLVSEFIRQVSEEQAWMSGDSDGEWAELKV